MSYSLRKSVPPGSCLGTKTYWCYKGVGVFTIHFFISSHQCLDDDWNLPDLQFFQWLAYNIVLGLSNIGCVK